MDAALRHLTRRQALGALTGGGAALLAAGCESAVAQARKGSTGSGGPVRGGVLAAGISADLIPGNILTNSTAGITTMIGLVYDSLIRYPNDTVTPTPRLATAWNLSSDGLSLTLDLRHDVRFHTGRKFTSADVEFSIKTYADPLWNGQLKSTAAAITRFDTSRPYRIVLHMEHPLGNVFDLLDTVPILDHETAGDIGTGKRFVGTGPFVFESWTPNSELVFRRNPRYWVPGRPYLDGVHVAVMPNTSSLVSAIKSSQVQIANGVSYRDIELTTRDDRFYAITLDGAEQQIYVGTNVTRRPLNDIRVRRAIAHSLDRDRIVKEVFREVGYVANVPWPKYSIAYDAAKNRTYTRDVTTARSLLASAGGSLPTVPLTYGTGSLLVEATALIVQDNLKAAGLRVELDPVDPAQFIKLLIGGKFEGMWTTFHSWAQYTPSTLTSSAYPFNAHKNASVFSAHQYTDDADRAWKERDGTSPAARADYHRLSDDLLRYLFLIEIGIIPPQWVASKRLHGVSYTKRMEIDLSDAYLA